jgi:amidophosphoribosyltransferase
MASQDQLIASHATVEQIRQHIGATSLGYLSTDGLSKAMSLSNENFCLACFTGTYPIDIPDAVRAGKDAFEPSPRR